MHGLRITPDLDSCLYTLGGGIDPERGWGRAGETWTVREELAAYDAEPSWFSLGDRDIATHLVRTRMLRAGYRLSDVVTALCHRWRPGVTLLPGTDDRVETHVVVDDPATGPAGAQGDPLPGVVGAPPRRAAGAPLRPRSGPTRRAVLPARAGRDRRGRRRAARPVEPGREHRGAAGDPRDARRPCARPRPVSSGSPRSSAAGPCAAWRTPACTAIGVETTAEAVGRHYGARADGGLLDGWLVHTGDRADVPGVEVRNVPLLMSDVPATAAMARAALDLCGAPVG